MLEYSEGQHRLQQYWSNTPRLFVQSQQATKNGVTSFGQDGVGETGKVAFSLRP